MSKVFGELMEKSEAKKLVDRANSDKCFICDQSLDVDAETSKVLYHLDVGPVYVHDHHKGVKEYDNEVAIDKAKANATKLFCS